MLREAAITSILSHPTGSTPAGGDVAEAGGCHVGSIHGQENEPMPQPIPMADINISSLPVSLPADTHGRLDMEPLLVRSAGAVIAPLVVNPHCDGVLY